MTEVTCRSPRLTRPPLPATAPKPGWFIPEPSARNSAKRRKRCFSPRAMSTTPPRNAMFERRMIELEGAEAGRSTATGMAAVTTAILAPLKAGDHVVAAKAMFGSCRYVVEDLLPRYGIASTLVDGLDLEQWQRAMRPTTKSFFLESPTNPTLDVLDISAIAEIAHAGGARLIVDNVFATPIWQSPLTLGADVVVYSATKHIDGQGRCLGGMILSSETFVAEHLHNFMRQTGPSLSPFNAWVLLK